MYSRQVPLVLLTFAQSSERSETALGHLEEEKQRLSRLFVRMKERGRVDLLWEQQLTNELISERLANFPGQLSILHFGGHANGERLSLEDGRSYVQGLAAGIRLSQPTLQLLFLNGCSTLDQAAVYLRSGVKVVIATTNAIRDDHAARFALRFYEEMEGRASIRTAFERAGAFLRQLQSTFAATDIPLVIPYRGAGFAEEAAQLSLPWRLFYQAGEENMLDWKLPFARRELTRLPFNPAEVVIGREAVLPALHRELETSRRLVVRGIGGIGKTVVAREYVRQYRAEYRHLAWVEQSGRLQLDFLTHPELAARLDIPFAEKESEEDRFARVMQALEQLPGPNLLIIDNADEQLNDREIRRQFPSPSGWAILTTSRRKLEAFKDFRLDKLPPEPAHRLFEQYYEPGTEEETKKLDELLAYIDYHPLTIELFAKTLANSWGDLSPAILLEKLNQFQLADEEYQEYVKTGHATEEMNLYRHLRATFDQSSLSVPEAHLLRQLLFLPPFDIPVRTLKTILSPQKQLNALLRALDTKGWIDADRTKGSLRMHRLVQEVLFYALQPTLEDAKGVIKSVSHRLATDQARDNPTDTFRWVPFGESLLRYLPEERGPLFYELQNNLALVYYDLGRYGEAIALLEKVYAANRDVLGPNHPDLAAIRANLGLAHQEAGAYELAIELMAGALEVMAEYYGPAHPTTLSIQSNRALALKEAGRDEEALFWSEQAFEAARSNYDPGDPTLDFCRSTQGKVLQDLGRWEEAASLLEVSLESYRQKLPPDHPNVTRSQADLALVYKDLGRYAAAVDLMEEALAADRRSFGEAHPNTIYSQIALALVYQQQGKYEDAAGLLEQSLALNEAHFGTDHPGVAMNLANLAIVYRDLKRYEAAEELARRALAIDEQNFGPEHPSVGVRQFILGSICRSADRKEEAANWFAEAHRTFFANLGPDHPKTRLAVREREGLGEE